MKNAAKKEFSYHTIQSVLVSALLVFIVGAFFEFFHENRQRISDQTDSYIKDSTEQTCARLQDVIATAQKDIRLLSSIYSQTLTEPELDVHILQEMTKSAVFDDAEFVAADGTVLTAAGKTADLSDRPHFQDGMKGNSGKTLIHNSRTTHDTKMVFYTPFYFDGEIIGVLSGVLRESTIYDILSTEYFGVPNKSYLIERDGSVILSYGDERKPQNLLDSLTGGGHLSAEDRKKLESVLNDANQIDCSTFNYKGSNGSGNAYIMPLAKGWGGVENSEWLLVQMLQSAVTQDMVKDVNSAGLRLGFKLGLFLTAYLLYLLMRGRKQKKYVIAENKEYSRIIDAIMTLFSCYALVDLEKDTFKFDGDIRMDDMNPDGSFTDLVSSLEPKFLSDNGNGETMARTLSAEYLQEHLTENVPYLQYEYQIRLDRGGPHWENLSVLCLERRDNLPAKILLAIQDTDVLKKREIRIREALQEVSASSEAANRSKTDFLARMSHDMRTPMNAIMGMTSIALMNMDNRERLTDCLSKITASSRHLLSLINDVLDMSKIESGKITLSEEPFNLADLIDGILAIIRTQTDGKNQQLNINVSGIKHEDVIGDTLRLRQVLINILGNAVKFTPEGGMITFSIRECRPLCADMACYEFVCEDNGIGMDADFVKTIFEPFSRAQNAVKQNIEGTGLGMSITRSIVQMMNGSIQVESEAGAGSVFTVRVHLKQQEPGAGDTAELADLRVLVVDDDQNCCVSLADLLESIGVEAQWVLSGDEGVQKMVEARESGNAFAAVILDWKMPGKSGIDTAREIRREMGGGVPIIILSTYDWSEIEDQAREAGIGAFVAKPLFKSRLIYALKSVLPGSGDDRQGDGLHRHRDHKDKRVLLVDDNELNREIALELLSNLGVHAETAQDGRIAVDMVKNSPEGYYDLIFMDIQMPVVDGYEATRQIRSLGREDTARIPIVALSANAFDDDVRKAKKSGMNAHVSKPVEFARLREILDKWL